MSLRDLPHVGEADRFSALPKATSRVTGDVEDRIDVSLTRVCLREPGEDRQDEQALERQETS